MTDIIWATEPERLVRIYFPELEGNEEEEPLRPGIVDLHGGVWTFTDRKLDEISNRALAKAGFVVCAFDFRQGGEYPYPAASEDSADAYVWLRENAAKYRIDPNRIGILGSSSGGQLAMHAGLIPNFLANNNKKEKKEDKKEEEKEEENSIPPPSFIIALWPVSDPFARYKYAQKSKNERLVQAHNNYFKTENNMKKASIPNIILSGGMESLPPLCLVVAGEDGNVPTDIQMSLLGAYQYGGGYVEYNYFPGEVHGFGLREGEGTERMVELVVSFAKRFSEKKIK